MSAQPSAADDAARRLRTVRARIDEACQRSGRHPRSVILIGVGKTHPPTAVQRLVELGLTDVAENRVAELVAKQPRVQGAHWHFVGQLQRRKVRDLIGRRVLIHSVDRESLARELARRAERASEVQRVLVQVNVGGDPAKAGCHVDEALGLVAYARDLPHLSVEGLMTIPPLPDDDEDAAEAARPLFDRLRALRDRARQRWPEVTHLSMGMSADFETAIEAGATMIRVGTALFGPRGDAPWQPPGENR